MSRMLARAAILAASTAAAAQPPEIAGMEAGRKVWLGTCVACHAEPDSGAPQLGDAAAWRPRLAKGRAVLYQHALNGFFGDAGAEMPPRGANPALSDDEVRRAVDYMLAASLR